MAGNTRSDMKPLPIPPTVPDPRIEENRLFREGTGVGTARPIWDGGQGIWSSPEQAEYDTQQSSLRPSMQSLGGGGATSARMAPGGGSPAPRDTSHLDTTRALITGALSNSPPQVSRTEGPSAVQEEANRSAAFARAKETAGQNAQASMKALTGVMDERGMMGSSVEAGQAGHIVGGAGAGINEFLRDQAISEADRATGIADTEYEGQIQQRQQDQSRKQALLSLLGGLY